MTARERLPACRDIPDLDVLTPYQRSIALLVAEGLGNAEIARRLGKTESTIRTHVNHIYNRLHIATGRNQAPRVRLARIVWVSQVDALVATLLEREVA